MVEEVQITMRKLSNRDAVEGSINLMIKGRHIQLKAKNEQDFWQKAEKTLRDGGFQPVYVDMPEDESSGT